jgi:hypothetical protein
LPDDQHPGADQATVDPEFLVVQSFDGGRWTTKDGKEGVHVLTLSGADANAVCFLDRAARIVGLAPTLRFLDGLGFAPDNPRNAALVAHRPEGGEQEVLVIERSSPPMTRSPRPSPTRRGSWRTKEIRLRQIRAPLVHEGENASDAQQH